MSSDDECNSDCNTPCTNEKHKESLMLDEIVSNAFKENALFTQQKPKSKMSMILKDIKKKTPTKE